MLESIYIFRSWDTYRYIHIILVSFIFSDLILFFYYCVVLLAISQKKWRRGSPNFATVVESFTALMECKRMDPGYKVIIINSFFTHCKNSLIFLETLLLWLTAPFGNNYRLYGLKQDLKINSYSRSFLILNMINKSFRHLWFYNGLLSTVYVYVFSSSMYMDYGRLPTSNLMAC